MMPSMPVIDGSDCLQHLPAALWMHISPRPIGFGERLQQHHPTKMQRFQQRQRNLNRKAPRILQLRPLRLFIWLDRRPILRQSKPHPYISIDMAVSHMVDQLPHRPSTLTVRSIKLLVTQAVNRRTQSSGQPSNRRDVPRSIRLRPVKIANGIAKRKGSIQRRRNTHALEGITTGRPTRNLVLRMVVMVVMMTPVMAPMAVRRLRLRSHRGHQKQQQRSEEKLFHTLRIPSNSEMSANPPQPKTQSGHTQ
jgi:hypothetical protein